MAMAFELRAGRRATVDPEEFDLLVGFAADEVDGGGPVFGRCCATIIG